MSKIRNHFLDASKILVRKKCVCVLLDVYVAVQKYVCIPMSKINGQNPKPSLEIFFIFGGKKMCVCVLLDVFVAVQKYVYIPMSKINVQNPKPSFEIFFIYGGKKCVCVCVCCLMYM